MMLLLLEGALWVFTVLLLATITGASSMLVAWSLSTLYCMLFKDD